MIVSVKEKDIEIKLCTSFISRLKGFMFQKKEISTGLCFPKCHSIHTIFMRQHIDVIITDKNNIILALYPNLKPGSIIYNKKAYYIYELPLNSIQDLKIKDKLVRSNYETRVEKK